MAEVASAFVSLLPSARGFGPALDKEIGDDVEGSGKTAGSKFGGALKLGAIAAVGALGAGIVGAMNVEAANDKLTASLGLSAQESKRIGGIAGKLYAGAYGDSLEEVNTAVGAVIKNIDGMGQASSKELQSVTASVLDLATAFDQDLGMTTAAVGQLIRTGLVKNAKEGLDLLTVGLQGPANKADDLLETFNEYGTQFRKLGLDGKESMGLLSQGLLGGARDADVVADAIKEFSIRTLEALETTDSKGRKQMTELGQAFTQVIGPGRDMYKVQADLAAGGSRARGAFDMMLDGLAGIKDPAQRSATAVALFGTQAEDMGSALYDLDLDTATKQLGNVEGAADRMGKSLNDNAKTNIESFKRQFMTGFVNVIGGFALPVVNSLASALATNLGPAFSLLMGALGSVVGFLQQHTTTAKVLLGVVVALAAATAAHGAVLAVTAAGGMAAWLKGTRLISAATRVWAAVQWVLNAAMVANPLGLVVIAVVALVAAFVIAYKRSETFRKIVNAAFDGVRKVVSAVVGWFAKYVPKVFSAVVSAVRAYVNAYRSVVVGAFNIVRSVVMAVMRAVGSAVRAGASAFTAAVAAVRRFQTGTISAVRAALSIIVSIPGRARSALGNLGSTLLNAGRELIDGLIRGISDRIGAVRAKMSELASAIRGYLPGSPVKTGPLRSWNNGGAGKRLVGMLASGLEDTRRVDAAMTRLSSRIQVAAPRVDGLITGGTSAGVNGSGAGRPIHIHEAASPMKTLQEMSRLESFAGTA